MWALGDYDRIADGLAISTDQTLRVAKIRQGERVLDIATRTGITAIAARECGEIVTGVDQTPELLAVAVMTIFFVSLSVRALTLACTLAAGVAAAAGAAVSAAGVTGVAGVAEAGALGSLAAAGAAAAAAAAVASVASVASAAWRWRGALNSSRPASEESRQRVVLFMIDYRAVWGVTTSERNAAAPMPNSEPYSSSAKPMAP